MSTDNIVNSAVNALTQRISHILDSANHLTTINMGSKRGRQFVAATIARQLIDGRGKEDGTVDSQPTDTYYYNEAPDQSEGERNGR